MNEELSEKLSAYDRMRNIIISRLEEAKKKAEDDDEGEAFHWVRPWSGSGLPTNVSYLTEEPYRGINQIVLSLATHGAGDEWLTFNTIKNYHDKDSKVKLRKGAKGQNVIYFDKYIRKDKDGNPIDVDDDGNPVPRAFAKVYCVFSVEDVEGLSRKSDNVTRYEHDESVEINRLESILAYYIEATSIELEVVDGGNRAFFMPASNIIRIPDKNNFKSVASYAHTIAHEAIHSTGKALGRDMSNVGFGSKAYSAEELVADIGADFFTNRLHIISESPDDDELKNSIAYIDGWLNALQSKDDKVNICKAASDAQMAVDFIFETALEKMREEMQEANRIVLLFENGIYLYVERISDDSFKYAFYDSTGKMVDCGVKNVDSKKTAYDVAVELLRKLDISIEEGTLLPVNAFEEWVHQQEESKEVER